MRKLLIAVGLLLAAGSAKGQENRGFEVSGNYQYVRFNPGGGSDGINCHGGSGSVGAYLTSRIGVIGEFGACKVTGLPAGATAHELNYLFGPRVYFPTSRGRVFPFVQALLGGEQFSAGASGLGVKQRFCDDRRRRGGCNPLPACFLSRHSGRVSLYALRWRFAEQLEAAKRHRVAHRPLVTRLNNTSLKRLGS